MIKEKSIREVTRKAGKASWGKLTPAQKALRIEKMNKGREKKRQVVKKALKLYEKAGYRI